MPRKLDDKVANRNRQIERQVKRFNAKITRAAKNNPLADFLPEKLSVARAKEMYVTDKDVAQLVRSVDRLFNKGALQIIQTKGGVVTTKYQLREIELGIKRINRARQKELELAQPSLYKGTMRTIKENNLRKKRTDVQNITQSNWDKFVESVQKQSVASYYDKRRQVYKDNYLKVVEMEYGKDSDLYAYVKSLSADQVYDALYQNPMLNIKEAYRVDGVDDQDEVLLEQWTEMFGDEQ